MKKLFCILMVIICFTAASASAGRHIAIQGSFSSSPEIGPFFLGLYEQDGIQTIISTLFPLYALVLDQSEDQVDMDLISLLFSIQADTLSSVDKEFGNILKDWLKQQDSSSRTGVFSGDLFMNATTVKNCSFRLSDIRQYLSEHYKLPFSNNINADAFSVLISSACSMLQAAAECGDPFLRVGIYDGGKYYTILIDKEENTMMSFSLDLSSSPEKRILAVSREDGVYCHRLIRYTPGTDRCTLDYMIWTGVSSVFPGENTAPDCSLYTEIMKEDNATGFAACFSARTLEKQSEIAGSIISAPDGAREITAAIRIAGYENETLLIRAVLDQAVPDLTGLTEMHVQNETENAMLRLSVYSEELRIASEMFSKLPVDYQQMLWALIFE